MLAIVARHTAESCAMGGVALVAVLGIGYLVEKAIAIAQSRLERPSEDYPRHDD